MPRLTSLDGLRGYAALAVFLYHVLDLFYPRVVSHDIPGAPTPAEVGLRSLFDGPLGTVVNGRFAVVVFFVLSGFVLTGLMHSAGGRAAPQVFVFQRLGRLLPVAVAGTAVGFVVLWAGLLRLEPLHRWNGATRLDVYAPAHQAQPKVDEFVWQAGYEIWAGSDSLLFNSVLWTIGIEFRASILLMLWLSVFVNSRSRWAVHAGGLVVGAIVVGRYYPCFVAGSCLAELWFRGRYPGWLRSPGAGLALAALAASAGGYDPDAGAKWIDDLVPYGVRRLLVSSLGGAAAVATALAAGPLAWVLAARTGRWLGRYSYAFYAVHQPLLHSAGAGAAVVLIPLVGYDVAAVAGALLAAVLSYSFATALTAWVDTPFNNWGKRASARLVGSPAPAEGLGARFGSHTG